MKLEDPFSVLWWLLIGVAIPVFFGAIIVIVGGVMLVIGSM